MEEQENARIIRALFDNLNARDFDASDPYIAEDYQAIAPGWPGPLNREQVKSTFQANFKAFPDLRYELQDVIAQGNKGAATWEMSGTHQGDLVAGSGQTIPATNRTVRLRASTVYDFKDGQITRQETYFDMVAFLSQLGLMAAAQSA
jgi:steroid delta-isomerase-like uncharacterized protein